ncbi:MAG: thermonuclease family protein [Phycisphaerales bacterium]|nr:MAG: thermonuclease family protein [Phycisphaerales bacterium]
MIYPGRLRRHPIATVALLVLLGLAVLDRGFAWFGRSDDYSRYHNRSYRVVNVVDGDTFDVDIGDGRFPTTRIRLWGVDTPEVAGSRDGEMYYGPQASAFARDMLTDKAVRVVLSPTKTRGKYGRLLAYVYIEPGGRCVNERLLETGHAYADWRFDHPRKREFEAIEDRARRQAVGLWSEVTPERFPPWRRRMEGASDDGVK